MIGASNNLMVVLGASEFALANLRWSILLTLKRLRSQCYFLTKSSMLWPGLGVNRHLRFDTSVAMPVHVLAC